ASRSCDRPAINSFIIDLAAVHGQSVNPLFLCWFFFAMIGSAAFHLPVGHCLSWERGPTARKSVTTPRAANRRRATPQQLRQLGDVCRNPPRLIAREVVRRKAARHSAFGARGNKDRRATARCAEKILLMRS